MLTYKAEDAFWSSTCFYIHCKFFGLYTCIYVFFFPLTGLIPQGIDGLTSIKCLMISKLDGSCKSYTSSDQATLHDFSVSLDPVFDVLWR